MRRLSPSQATADLCYCTIMSYLIPDVPMQGPQGTRFLRITVAQTRIIKQLAPAFRKALGNTGWLMADRVVRLGFGLFVGVWVARYLGPAQFGRLNFAMSYVGLFTTISTLGLDNIVVRNIVREISHAPEIIGTTFALRLAGSVLAPLIAVGIIQIFDPNDGTSVLVDLLSIGMIFQHSTRSICTFNLKFKPNIPFWQRMLRS